MAAPRRPTTQARYAVALYRVSTAEQGHSGLGLEAQQASVRAFVEREGWMLVAEHQDIASGKDDRRPGFQAALTRCRQLGAALVTGRLDRITRRARVFRAAGEGHLHPRGRYAGSGRPDDLKLWLGGVQEAECISVRLLAARDQAKRVAEQAQAPAC